MTRFVPGDGPVPCRYLLCGEGPGAEEDKWGRSWVGKSGRELWRYLWRACGLTRDDVYATNLVKYRVPDDGDPTPEDIARDAPLLEEEIANVKPEVIVTLGRWSSRHFLGELDMDWAHGVPQMVAGTVVMPIVHPAAGLHSTEFQGTIAWDFEQLGKLLRGEIEPRVLMDEYPEPQYSEVDRHEKLVQYSPAAVDTEGSAVKPWCLSYAVRPGEARVLMRGQSRFRHVIFHNAMHDIGVCRALDCEYESFDDTMIAAYLLCVEPQGLKALAKRHCGMEMRDYSELVAEPSRRHAIDYLVLALGAACDNQSSKELSVSSRTATKSRKPTRAKGGRKSARTRPRAGRKSSTR